MTEEEGESISREGDSGQSSVGTLAPKARLWPVLTGTVLVYGLLLAMGFTGLSIDPAPGGPKVSEHREEKPAPELPEIPLTSPQVACAFIAPRFDYLINSITDFEQGLIAEDELAIEAVVGAQRLLNAARSPGLANDFVQWLTSSSSMWEQFGYDIWSAGSVPQNSPVFAFQFADLEPFCPEYAGENPIDGVKVASEVPYGLFYLQDSFDWLTCGFYHLEPETAGQIGATHAIITLFVERSGELLYFEQAEVPLSSDQLGAEYPTDIGSVFVVPVADLGPVEGFIFQQSLLPSSGDIRVGCSKQFVGEFAFPRVVEEITLDSYRLRQIGLR